MPSAATCDWPLSGVRRRAIGDSPAGWHEMYISLTIAAQESPNATVAPYVTSPFVRHPIINANAMCSLADAYGDRFVLGLATGAGAMSWRSATPRRTRNRYAITFRRCTACLRVGRGTMRVRRYRRCVMPYSAFGAKALALAGEQADGVILFTSHDLEALGIACARVLIEKPNTRGERHELQMREIRYNADGRGMIGYYAAGTSEGWWVFEAGAAAARHPGFPARPGSRRAFEIDRTAACRGGICRVRPRLPRRRRSTDRCRADDDAHPRVSRESAFHPRPHGQSPRSSARTARS